jgi:hypothetical protein
MFYQSEAGMARPSMRASVMMASRVMPGRIVPYLTHPAGVPVRRAARFGQGRVKVWSRVLGSAPMLPDVKVQGKD